MSHDESFMMKIDGPQALSRAIYEMVHATMHSRSGNDGVACMEIASSAALGCLINAALILCKKPQDIPVGLVPKHRAEEIITKGVTPETIVFAALLAAAQFEDTKRHDENSMALVATFGSGCFATAYTQWMKIFPDKNIDDYFEEGCCKLCRKALDDAANDPTFNRVITARPGFTLRNNGSIN